MKMLLLVRIRLRRITATQTTALPITPTIKTMINIKRSVHRIGAGSIKLPLSVGETVPVSFLSIILTALPFEELSITPFAVVYALVVKKL